MLPTSNGVSLDAELTVGDKEETIETNIGSDRTSQVADTINNSSQLKDIPLTWVLLFMLMAGWAIPSPSECGRGLITFMKVLLPFGANNGRT